MIYNILIITHLLVLYQIYYKHLSLEPMALVLSDYKSDRAYIRRCVVTIMYIKIHVHVWLCLQLLFHEIIVKIIMIPEVHVYGVYNSIGTFDVHVSYNMYIQIHIHVWSCLQSLFQEIIINNNDPL